MPTNFDSILLTAGYLNASAVNKRMGVGTIGTTGTVLSSMIAEYAGTLALVQFVANDGLIVSDTNYITLAIQNKGSGGANVAMLAATAANTTQSTGGTALTAFTKRTLTLHATPANLAIAVGDTLIFSAAVTGTLGAQVAGGSFLITITPS